MSDAATSSCSSETMGLLRAPWVVRRGERFPAWFAAGAVAMANVKFVPVDRHKVQAFVLTNAEVDAFNARNKPA